MCCPTSNCKSYGHSALNVKMEKALTVFMLRENVVYTRFSSICYCSISQGSGNILSADKGWVLWWFKRAHVVIILHPANFTPVHSSTTIQKLMSTASLLQTYSFFFILENAVTDEVSQGFSFYSLEQMLKISVRSLEPRKKFVLAQEKVCFGMLCFLHFIFWKKLILYSVSLFVNELRITLRFF